MLAPLLYEVSVMVTVRRGVNFVVVGGIDKRGKELNTLMHVKRKDTTKSYAARNGM